MLDAFEQRTADLVADQLSGIPAVVTRPREELNVLLTSDPTRPIIVVEILTADPDLRLGDDGRERLGVRGSYTLRPVLYLRGELAISLQMAPTPAAGDQQQTRRTLFGVLERLLIQLNRDAIRTGVAFQTGDDLGFDLDKFHLVQILPLPGEDPVSHQARVRYQYSGRFWPVEPPVEGDLIEELPTRIAILPIQIPEGLATRAGGSDMVVPLHLDLRALNGAQARVIARLHGAAPPGALIGDATEVPPDSVGYVPDAGGTVEVVYRPPATLSSATKVRVGLGLAHGERPSIPLGELTIGVMP